MAIEVIKARTKQQIEQGYAVREQTMVRGESVPHDVEFDDDSAENPVYFLALSNGKPLGTCRAVKLAVQKNIPVQSSAPDQEEAAVQNSASDQEDAAMQNSASDQEEAAVQNSASDQEDAAVQSSAPDRGDAAVQKAQKGAAIGNNTTMQTDAGRKDIAASQEDAAAAEERFADTVKLERIAVLTNRQHSGIGTALIRGAEDILRREGVKKVIINSRDKALGFYERLGYRRMSTADAEYCLAQLPKISRYEGKGRCGAADIGALSSAAKNVPNAADNAKNMPDTAENAENVPNTADNAKNMPDTADNAGNMPNAADNIESMPNAADGAGNAPNTAGIVHNAPVVQQNTQLPDCVDDRGFPGYLVEHIL